ncbi:MAG: zinc finger BED domain-containing protein [Deltaproteobacteria bacterium]|nr:zinc finger BED domain-containing protein [Deltaproteobacteria bacterium]
MSIDEFKKIMGEPCKAKDGLLVYNYFEEIELKPDDPGYSFCKIGGKSVAYRGSGITARFVNGILQWVDIRVADGYTC